MKIQKHIIHWSAFEDVWGLDNLWQMRSLIFRHRNATPAGFRTICMLDHAPRYLIGSGVWHVRLTSAPVYINVDADFWDRIIACLFWYTTNKHVVMLCNFLKKSKEQTKTNQFFSPVQNSFIYEHFSWFPTIWKVKCFKLTQISIPTCRWSATFMSARLLWSVNTHEPYQ